MRKGLSVMRIATICAVESVTHQRAAHDLQPVAHVSEMSVPFPIGITAMRRLDQISDDELKAADGIQTYDPGTMQTHSLWRNESSPPAELGQAPDRRLKMVDIRVHADDSAGLLAAITRVEQIKGQLTTAAQELRDALKK
jgi:hypothetical protein